MQVALKMEANPIMNIMSNPLRASIERSRLLSTLLDLFFLSAAAGTLGGKAHQVAFEGHVNVAGKVKGIVAVHSLEPVAYQTVVAAAVAGFGIFSDFGNLVVPKLRGPGEEVGDRE